MKPLSAPSQTAMLAHAVAGLPNEACGLFAGPVGTSRVDVFYPMTNTANSSQIYELDGQEMLAAESEAEDVPPPPPEPARAPLRREERRERGSEDDVAAPAEGREGLDEPVAFCSEPRGASKRTCARVGTRTGSLLACVHA